MRKASFVRLLTQYPDDLFVHMAYINAESRDPYPDRSALIARYAALAQAKPDNERFAFLKALSLEGSNTPETIKTLAQQKTNPWAHARLAQIYFQQKFADKPRAQTELDAFFSACSVSWYLPAWNSVSLYGDVPMARAFAPRLRKQLEADTDNDHFVLWPTLWKLEFKARPVTQHEELRKLVASDIVRLRRLRTGPEDATWLDLLKDAHKLAGDQAAVKQMEDALIARFPDSTQGLEVAEDRWYAKHPPPDGDTSEEARKAFYQAELERATERLKHKPDDTRALIDKFYAISSLDDSTAAEINRAADLVLANRENGNLHLRGRIWSSQLPGPISRRRPVSTAFRRWSKRPGKTSTLTHLWSAT